MLHDSREANAAVQVGVLDSYEDAETEDVAEMLILWYVSGGLTNGWRVTAPKLLTLTNDRLLL